MPVDSWQRDWGTCMARTWWFWACHEAGCLWRSRWRRRSTRHWMSSWCASWGSRSSPNWPWGPSVRGASGCSTLRCWRAPRSPKRSCARQRDVSGDCSKRASHVCGGAVSASTWTVALRSSLTTALRRGQLRAWRVEWLVASAPRRFMAVGNHCRDFSPTSDEEVIVLLDAAARRMRGGRAAGDGPDCDIDVEIPVGAVALKGHLHLPEPAAGVVLFAHGSGSSRHSPRNRFVADVLYQAGLGTLLLDLLTPQEELNRANVFDMELLASRLTAVTRWLGSRPDTTSCSVGYFGASTGAGAALCAAADAGAQIAAVVSRGGRPDLAGPLLAHVRAPTLLIVGSADEAVLKLNHRAQAQLRCPRSVVWG